MCHYRILGVSRDASKAAIRRAYLEKAKRLHPDVNHRAEAENTFKRLQQAYAVLSDDNERKQFDSENVWAGSREGGTSRRSPPHSTFHREFYEESTRMKREHGESEWNRLRMEINAKRGFGSSERRDGPTPLDLVARFFSGAIPIFILF